MNKPGVVASQRAATDPPALDARQQSAGIVRGFFSNPVVGVIGTVASVVSVILAVAFYQQSRSFPALTYCVDPVRITLVQRAASSDLAVSYKGRGVYTDVSAVQIAVWNAGRQAIRHQHILRPLTLFVGDRSPILQAVVRRTNRDVVGLRLDTTKIASGAVSMQWDILETGDGGVVQIVYAGPVDAPVRATGVFEGQEAPHRRASVWRFRSAREQYRSELSFLRWMGAVGIGSSLLLAVVFWRIRSWPGSRGLRNAQWVPLAALALMCLWALASSFGEGPPFGF